MYLTEHVITQYRNIGKLTLEPSKGINVISGQNGQGKTNLLESIFLMTGARSFRAVRDFSLLQTSFDYALLSSNYVKNERLQSIRMKISSSGRIASLNGATESAAVTLAGNFCCVIFSPEHLILVKGSPEHRRRFIDTALCQISPAYMRNLKNYTHMLAQRNALLKEASTMEAAMDLLDVYDAQYVDLACALTATRRRFTAKLLLTAQKHYAVLSGDREKLHFVYQSSLHHADVEEMEHRDRVLALLRAKRGEEIKTGYSLLGPHRDDLLISLSNTDARMYSSQGQQRCIVLSFKLAEADIMQETTGERPVLLLDDVLSELDGQRQDYLIDSISAGQSVITSCTPNLIAGRTEAQVFTIENGSLKGN